ncbi:MAG: DUF3298 and DUF4163 domain-containing protein, partial [Paramuribaculum sp.]|nr:DUF3298 and DUF4163 domain-containing protein [Paramuribaculum sp.]
LVTQVFSIKKSVRVQSIGGPQRMECSISVEYPMSGPTTLVANARLWIKNQINSDYKGALDNPKAMLLSAAKSWRDAQETSDIKVVYSTGKSITYCDEAYSYIGGNHGMGGNLHATFLFGNGRQLTKSDLPRFSKWNMAQLMSRTLECKPSEVTDYLFQGIPTEYPDCVYLGADGIHIVWGEYEIAPYAVGQINVLLSGNKADFSGTASGEYF